MESPDTSWKKSVFVNASNCSSVLFEVIVLEKKESGSEEGGRKE